MKKVAVIVAGGLGTRMQSEILKQFLALNGLPVLMHTMNRFYAVDTSCELRVVLPDSEIENWNKLCKDYNFTLPHKIFSGGETRYYSVKNGLQDLPSSSIVAIHDGVRPLVSTGTINRCYELAEKNGTAVPVVPVSESIRQVEGEDSVSVERTLFRLVQTPQVFNSDILLDAYNLPFEESFTDDASVIEKAGYKIYLTEGNEENIKITSQRDMLIAEIFLQRMGII